MDTSQPSANEPLVIRAGVPADAGSASSTGDTAPMTSTAESLTTASIKSILVPVDIHDLASFKALTYAVALAKVFHASVTLLYVVEEPALARFSTEDDHKRQARLHAVAEQQLQEAFERDVAPHVSGTHLVRAGRADETPIVVAKEISADLIVILAHVWTGLAHLINTNPADKVIRNASCPVLVVKEEEREFIAPTAGNG